MGSAALELVFKLLDIKTNETVIKACNVVKVMILQLRVVLIFLLVFLQLIGYLLSYETPKVKEFDPVVKLETVLTIFRLLTIDDSLR